MIACRVSAAVRSAAVFGAALLWVGPAAAQFGIFGGDQPPRPPSAVPGSPPAPAQPQPPTRSQPAQPFTQGTLRNELNCIWSVFLCARSLRATKELSHGGPGVIGAYDMINLVVGPTGSPPTTTGQLRSWSPIAQAEPFIFVGLELLGQTTTETVYEVQMKTRVQL